VTHVRAGEEVYGMRQGAFAEYVAGMSFVRKPKNLSWLEAASLPAAGCTALQALRDHGNVRAGQHVLVNGAGGGVGHLAVQLAKAFGAEVTATTSTDKVSMVRSLGADTVIDYMHEDFSHGKGRFDLIVDCASDRTIRATLRTLKPGGRLVMVGSYRAVISRIAASWLRSRLLRQPIVFFVASGDFRENLATLTELIEAGKLKPVIDRTFSLEDVPKAVEYAAAQQIAGKVAISVTRNSDNR
jgi:NADPH:quinone reductase-like Zn-dependent oxidoreductase